MGRRAFSIRCVDRQREAEASLKTAKVESAYIKDNHLCLTNAIIVSVGLYPLLKQPGTTHVRISQAGWVNNKEHIV